MRLESDDLKVELAKTELKAKAIEYLILTEKAEIYKFEEKVRLAEVWAALFWLFPTIIKKTAFLYVEILYLKWFK